MKNISITSGTEGPRHDPYSFTEYTFKGENFSIILHQGLGEWLQLGDARMNGTSAEIHKAFEVLTGYTVKQCERFVRKAKAAHYRAHKAHGGYEWSDGYPGESICFCKCGQCIDYEFNERAVI